MLDIFKKRAIVPLQSEFDRLTTELREVGRQLDITMGLFDMTDDTDMIDYHIHRLKALEAQYSHLLKEVKAAAECENTVSDIKVTLAEVVQ